MLKINANITKTGAIKQRMYRPKKHCLKNILEYVLYLIYSIYRAFPAARRTGKYTPLDQWLHLDFVEMLPDEVATDGKPTGSRYDHVVRLFGEKFVREKVMNAKTFMVSLFVFSHPQRLIYIYLYICVFTW